MDDIITNKKQVPYSSFFVLTNDTFMSGWGQATYKINTLIFACDSWGQAQTVADNAKSRTDQNRVRIMSGHAFQNYRLRYSNHFYQLKTQDSYPSWYTAGYFKRS